MVRAMTVDGWYWGLQAGSAIAALFAFVFLVGTTLVGRQLHQRDTSRMLALETELASAKNSLAAQREKTARAEQDVLELQRRIQPRRIAPDQRATLVDLLRASQPKGLVTITSLLGDVEGNTYAAQINEILTSAGWPTTGVNRVVMNGLPTQGIAMAARSAREVPPFAVALQQAFERGGIEILGAEKPILPPGVLELIVGIKPF